jgi:Skp family chaperone for outer membrane proteins
MILAKNELIDSILKGLYNAIGTSTQAQGIAFALPVDEVIGIDNNLNIKKEVEE